MSKVVELTDENFDAEIKNAKQPVLVDFFAPWCGHCRVQNPIIDKLADEFGDKAVIAKINVDENRNIASRYFISGIPAILLFKDGKPVAQKAGVQQLDELINLVLKHENN